MISLNGTQIKDPNNHSIVKDRVRGRHLTMASSYQTYGKNYKYNIAMKFNNITEAEKLVIENIYNNQFVDFDTINLVMADGYPEGDLNIEVFMRMDNLSYNANGRYNLEVSFRQR